MFFAVITTIQQPTASVHALAKKLVQADGQIVIVGDAKGPPSFCLQDSGLAAERVHFRNLQSQINSEFRLGKLAPTGHYCRKNLGYLHAIANDATCIYETDDDNRPLKSWTLRDEYLRDCVYAESGERGAERGKRRAEGGGDAPRWVNVYRHFSDQLIWPRGLPLDEIHEPLQISSDVPCGSTMKCDETRGVWAPIQQGLANGSPDVDAVWRLVLDREFCFDDRESLYLPPGCWCPFNTQSTWCWPAVYPLLYVPSYCSFRMCDIWKSFVAQRCLWELGAGVVFHAAEVVQDRNPHNLTRDFSDEVPGYLQNRLIADILEQTDLQSGTNAVADNLRRCYEALVKADIFPADELDLVDAWIEGVAQVRGDR